METYLKCTVRYDGTDFSGWQEQRSERSVQGDIQDVFSRIATKPVRIQGASRTDAGVHALGQVFNCVWPGPFPERLRRGASQLLSPEIRIESVEKCNPEFHSRHDARGKIYVYSLDFGREADPFSSRYAWNVPYPNVNIDLMQSLLQKLVGTHDFAGFQSTGSNKPRTTIRTLTKVTLKKESLTGIQDNPDLYRLEIHGNAFLYKMVRNITGTLIEIARGRFPADFLDECIASSGPFLGHCAPPQGLCLVRVKYAEDFQEQEA